MTQPDEDKLPLMYGRFGDFCAKTYSIVFEPMNNFLDKLSQKWYKFYFLDEEKFVSSLPKTTTVAEAGKQLYLSLHDKIELQWSVENNDTIIVWVETVKESLFVPSSWDGFKVKLVLPPKPIITDEEIA